MPPAFRDPNPVSMEFDFATLITFDCQVKSFKSKPSVTWLRNGKPLDFSDYR
jgi:hypothetical protein